jgi:hypothetical protein
VVVGGIAAVGPEFVRCDAGFLQLVEQRDQVAALVLVSGAEQDLQWQPARVGR